MHKESAQSFLKDNSLILLIVFIGLALRMYDLGGESLWLDEVFSVEMSRYSLVGLMKVLIYEGENHPPLYYMIMHFWVAVFGDSEAAIRLFSALVGTVSIFAVYKLGKLLFNKNTGLIAALVLAISVFQIKYSQEGRAYALVGLLSLISVYFFVRLLKSGDLKYSFGYLLSSILLVYTHYFGPLIIVAQNFYFFSIVLIDDERGKQYDLKRWIFLQSILVVLSSPELLLLKKASALQEGYWIPRPNFKGLIGIFMKYSGSIPLLIIFSILSLYAAVNSAAFMFKKSFGDLLMPKQGRSRDTNLLILDRVYLLIVLTLIPVVIPFIYSQFLTPIFLGRYMIEASLMFYLLVAEGVDNIVSQWGKLGLIVLISVMSLVNVLEYYHTVDKDQWREAMEYIEDNAGPGEVVMVYPDFVLRVARYYSKRKDLILVPLTDESGGDLDISSESGWVILADYGDKYHIGKKVFSRNDTILKEMELKRLKLYQFSRKPE